MKHTTILATATVALMATAAQAQETLLFATTNPEQHPINQNVMNVWAEQVNEAAAGAVEVDLRHGPMIANHTNFVDRVTDDVVQIAWGMTVFNPGKFPNTLVSTLPFIVDSAEQGSAAMCAMYEEGAFDMDFEGLKPLLFIEFPQASAHLNGGATLESLRDLAGKKVITSSPAHTAMVEANGGSPLSFSITEQYEALQRGAADGTIMNFTAFPGFRLDEVTTNHYVIPLGGAVGVVFMQQSVFDGLSPEAQQAIEANSGCEASRTYGAWVDQWEAEARGYVGSKEGHTITEAPDEVIAILREQVGPTVEAGLAERIPGGMDLVEMFKAKLEEAK